jgi:hypothetical protein
MTKRAAFAVACALFIAACSDDDEICSDGQDNDDNALVDCEDPACGPGAGCGPHGLVCVASLTCSTCSGNSGAAEPTGEATCGDGVDNDCDGLVDCADQTCQPQGAELGKLCDATGRRCTAPDAAGRSTCGPGGGGGTNPGTQGPIGMIRLAQAEHEVLGAFGSGYREQSLLTFEVFAADGTPYAGLPVAFSHESQGGSFIGPAADCTATSPPICTANGMTDADGRVGVLLRSGTRFASVSVRAEATAGGVTRRLVAGGFAVVGAKPNGARFSVDCRPYNVPAYTVHDCLYSRYKGAAREVDCTATLGDRHDNLVAVPTLVAFQAEAGLIVPGAFTPSFDPAQPVAGLGQAVGKLDVYGAPLPFDVEPFPWEHSLAHDFGCGLRTANPRDGLVSVIALVQGEEGFVDADLDGQYDEGEHWIDLGEPFLDVDDDGRWDPGEWYLDLDENLAYSPPNGRWDADTVLWTQARVLYTGYPEIGRSGTDELFTRFYLSGAPPEPTQTPLPFEVHAGPPPTSTFYDVFFTDRFFNPMSSFTTFGAEALIGNVDAKLSAVSHTADSLATTFRMLYCEDPALPSTCRDGPADQGCRTSPCYLKTEVGAGFVYGNDAFLSITCAEVGVDAVQVRTTIEGVSSVFSISGECLP